MSAAYIRSHASLRGIAALLVVSYHLQYGGGYHMPIEDYTPFIRRCYLFVDLFFYPEWIHIMLCQSTG
jgi:peptidoglycan/LPS O-acetylase OafA/YrhL